MKPTILLLTCLSLAATQASFGQPIITAQPQSQSAVPGASVIFSVAAIGFEPLGYQWRRNEAPLTGETNEILLLTDVQYVNSGRYSVVVTDDGGQMTTSETARLTVHSTFTKITTGPVVTDGGLSWDGTWVDYDGDGDLDLFVGNGTPTGGPPGRNFLYTNNGDGTFTKVTTGPVPTDNANSGGGSWGDYDNDGFPDLLAPGVGNDLFYRNNGDGAFTRITTGPLPNDGRRSPSATWGDFNNDGHLDVFRTSLFEPTRPCSLDRNNGNGTFTPVTGDSIVTEPGNFTFAEWADYDDDGWPDLFASKYNDQSNALYHNDGDGTFTRITAGSIVNDAGNSLGCSWADYDNDGFFDLFVANGSSGIEVNFLYHNNSDGTFTRITDDVAVNDVGHWAGCAWGDYDNDGFIDLFVSHQSANNALYHNNGDGTFARITSGSPANDGGASFGCAWGDYDNDGFLDLFVANGRASAENNFLYHNDGNSNAWLKVKLVGTRSNRSGIGAKVRVTASIGGQTVRQLRQIAGGNEAGGQSMLLAHFGLGDAMVIDTVRVEWPSGTMQELQGVAVRQLLTITEPLRLSAPMFVENAFQCTLAGNRGRSYGIQVSSNLVNWSPLMNVTVTNADGRALIRDSSAESASRRYYRATIGN
jgi:hypothetical protein